MAADFERWYEKADMPILLADGSGSRSRADGTRGQDGLQYHGFFQQRFFELV